MDLENVIRRLKNAPLRVLICGTGLVGPGIGSGFLGVEGGHHVTLVDPRQSALDEARAKIAADMLFLTGHGLIDSRFLDVHHRIDTFTSLEQVPDFGFDLVVEAITERLDAKQYLFRRLSGLCPKDAILTTNTSTLLASDILSVVDNPERSMALHFVNPAGRVLETEIAMTAQTDPLLFEAMVNLYRDRLGRRPSTIFRDQQGLLGNNFQFSLFDIAMREIIAGRSIEDVDREVRAVCQKLAATGVFGYAFLTRGLPKFKLFATPGNDPLAIAKYFEPVNAEAERFARALEGIDGLKEITGNPDGNIARAVIELWLKMATSWVNNGVSDILSIEGMVKAFARRYAATGIFGAAFLGGLPLFAQLYQEMAKVNGFKTPWPTILQELADGNFAGENPYASGTDHLAALRDTVLLKAILPS